MTVPVVRELEELSKEGHVRLALNPAGEIPIEERIYMWSACRFVEEASPGDHGCELSGSPLPVPPYSRPSDLGAGRRPKVVVTGCFDWLHSGHVRFFEEAATYGELTVVVGSNRNVSLLKGPRNPMFDEQDRRYLVSSIRHVHQSLISTGEGWMDAAPEIDAMKSDIYIVNEEGDKPEKQAFCQHRGIRYVVLHRAPATGLMSRSSTALRGY